ncbi:MAG: glycosyltransferase family 4 protein [Candidatus Methylacidiphilales bacterium]|nr:glycosyltransferase family 4 protein [Candidatus Methylacidiphilales bacterium]
MNAFALPTPPALWQNIPMAGISLLHTEWSMGWGGQEIRIVQEMREFRRLGYRVRLACRAGSRIGEEATKLEFPVDHLPFRGPADLWTAWRLSRMLRAHGVQIVHTHSSVDGWCAGMAARLAGVPVVRSRHLSSHVRGGLNARLVYSVLADRVISSGRHIREQLLAAGAGDPSRHVSVPAGADEARFHPGVDAAPVRAELGLHPGDRVVGMVAVLRSWKGHEFFLRAARLLHAEDPGMVFLIVGDGPTRQNIEQWIREWDLTSCVRLLGHRADVPELMKAMSVCVLPSLKNEATSQVLPQAMLVGTPVVSSSAGGLTEVVEDGVRGRVVEPGDPEALAAAIRAVFRDQEATRVMAEEARRFAVEELTFRRQIERTAAVYDGLLSLSGS